MRRDGEVAGGACGCPWRQRRRGLLPMAAVVRAAGGWRERGAGERKDGGANSLMYVCCVEINPAAVSWLPLISLECCMMLLFLHRAPNRAGDSHETAIGRERESAGREPAEEEGRFAGGCVGPREVDVEPTPCGKRT